MHKRAVFVSPQLALLEHFYSEPLSVLCCQKKEALLNVTQLGWKDLEKIRTLPSFKRCSADNGDICCCDGRLFVFQKECHAYFSRYVEKQEHQEQEILLTDDTHLKAQRFIFLITGSHRGPRRELMLLFCLFLLSLGSVSKACQRPLEISQELLSCPEVPSHPDFIFTSIPSWKTGKNDLLEMGNRNIILPKKVACNF